MKSTEEGPDLLSAWLWRLFVRQWLSVAGLTAVGLVVAAIAYSMATPLYSASALVRIGFVYHYGVLEGARAMAADMEATVEAPARGGGCLVESSFVEPAVEPTDSLVYLTVSCPDRDLAVTLVRSVVDPVVRRHAEAWTELAGSSPLSRPTKLLREPTPAASPARPARVIILLGAVVGLVLGLLVAALRQVVAASSSTSL